MFYSFIKARMDLYMNINNLMSVSKASVLTNSLLNFKGNETKLPEMPCDSFERINSTKFNVTRGLIEGDEAFQYYLASTDVGYDGGMQTFEAKNLGDKNALMDTVVVFDGKYAIDLGEQEVFQKLQDGESVEMINNNPFSSNKKSKADYQLFIPWLHRATIAKKDGNFIISASAIHRTAVARKSQLSQDTDYNTQYLNTIPQKEAEYYYKRYGYQNYLLPKSERIFLCDMNELDKCKDIFVLPTRKNGYVSFLPREQKGLASLKEGEKAMVGRYNPSPDDNMKRINVPEELSYATISDKHLLFENIDGKLYVTDVSRNGTPRANINDSISQEDWNQYFVRP
jgi:hypothetical protein